VDVQTCPSKEELLAYALGQLPDADLGRVADHLDRCPTCQQASAVLDWADDAVTETLRKPLPQDPFQDEPECRDLLTRAEAIATPPPAAPPDPPAEPPRTRPWRRAVWVAILAAVVVGGVLTAIASWCARVTP
jgi:anti-sigma factor RsiW